MVLWELQIKAYRHSLYGRMLYPLYLLYTINLSIKKLMSNNSAVVFDFLNHSFEFSVRITKLALGHIKCDLKCKFRLD